MRRDAQRINRLPVINVDPDLIAWSGSVSANLIKAANILSVGQTRATARASSVQLSRQSYGGGQSYAERESQASIDSENDRARRREAALQETSAAMEEASAIIDEIHNSRAQIRSELVDKYQAEF